MKKSLLFLSAFFLLVTISPQAQEVPEYVEIEIEEVNPWNHLNFDTDEEDFNFAIIADLTGHEREGVIEKAIHTLNRMQPEFVLSVGDLVEGNTEDTTQIYAEWERIDSLFNLFQMPFFYAVGNHDYENAAMARIWKERYGRRFYDFVYKDVLFVFLNSDEPTYQSISSEQHEFLEKTLAANQDVRWTFVILHHPLWVSNRRNGWREVENMLAGRKHTVIAGHTHSYRSYEINNSDYLVLSSTGAGISVRGMEYGEFDHFMWVSIDDDEPAYTNIMLDGVYDQHIRKTEINTALIDLQQDFAVTVHPLYYQGEFTNGKVEIDFINNTPRAIELHGGFQYNRHFEASPLKFDDNLSPGTTSSETFVIKTDAPLDTFDEPLELKTVAASQTDDGEEVTVEKTVTIIPVRTYTISKGPDVFLDGSPAEWEQAAWYQPKNESFRFSVHYSDQFLYLAVDVKDEAVIYGQPRKLWGNELFYDFTGIHWEADLIEFRIDAKQDPARGLNRGWDLFNGHLLIAVEPGDTANAPELQYMDKVPADMEFGFSFTDDGYFIEFAIPISDLDDMAGGAWNGLRLNVVQHNRHADGSFTRTAWKPDWRSPANVPGSGTFLKEEK